MAVERLFKGSRHQPLALKTVHSHQCPHLRLYNSLRQCCVEVLNKNRSHTQDNDEEPTAFLTSADIELIDAELENGIRKEAKELDKNLFILSTTVSLAPFLGLLGTVWGSLLTLAALKGANNSAVLEGLSMALATTVLGLVVAIPALVGYNYLKAKGRDFTSDMHHFSSSALTAIEMAYRKVD